MSEGIWEKWWDPVQEQKRRTVPGIWKTVVLGTMSLGEYRKALPKSNYAIPDLALHLMTHPLFTIASKPVEIDLVRIPVMRLREHLGSCLLRDVFSFAFANGLQKAPLEVFAALPLQHADLDDDPAYPHGEAVLLGADPLHASLMPGRPGRAFEGRKFWLGFSSGRDCYPVNGKSFDHRDRFLHLALCDAFGSDGLEDRWKGEYFAFVKPRR